MAATDQHYRNQKTLNIVFTLSSIAMLLTTLWMLVDDYNKPFKGIQREFRDVEETVNIAGMLEALPSEDDVTTARTALSEARKARDEKQKELDYKRKELQAKRDKADSDYQNIKAQFDAESSYRDTIDIELLGKAKTQDEKDVANKKLKERDETIAKLKSDLTAARSSLDLANTEFDREITQPLSKFEDNIVRAEAYLKELTGQFDRFAKVAAEKRWKGGDTFRNLPIIDGFAAPTRIDQIVLNDLPIDYGGFKDVTRYDRCATCHLGIENASFSRNKLQLLGQPDEANRLSSKLAYGRKILEDRLKSGETRATLGFDINDLPKKVKPIPLTPSQITQYATHPRLDLFVDSNSPHPKEKFGCTICHAGQGSATDFNLASHTPNDAAQQARWEGSGKDGHHWHSNHYWDFPMLPRRFTESSCLKCHHQVTDLVRFGAKHEAPHLQEGHQLVLDNGCYGCHEIAGTKGGRSIGPDLRVEPTPALEWLPVKDQLAAKADTLSPPGSLRKVGPSLRRTAEKSPADFLATWIKNPRGFRPDTKMPHFYDQSTNSAEYLKKTAPDQKDFPDAEIAAIVYYLQSESKRALADEDFTRRVVRLDLESRLKELGTTLDKIRALAAEPKQTTEVKLDLSELRRKQARLKKDLDGLRRRFRDLSLMSRPMDYRRINDLGEQLQQLLDATVEADLTAEAQKSLFGTLLGDQGVLAQLQRLSAPLAPLAKTTSLVDGRGDPIAIKDKDGKDLLPKADPAQGQFLFTTKGCLACHSHRDARIKTEDGKGPTEISDAHFGPELSRIAQKLDTPRDVMAQIAELRPLVEERDRILGKSRDDRTDEEFDKVKELEPKIKQLEGKILDKSKNNRLWLIQWILNPSVYHPRTRMPVTHLSIEEAASIADWLLTRGDDWKPPVQLEPGTDDFSRNYTTALRSLAELALSKTPIVGREYAASALKNGLSKVHREQLSPDSDEQLLVNDETGKLAPGGVDDKRLLRYVGKKAISRLGCYGCHDIPGFEAAKPIGTALNDWGKKDAERLAFEDAGAFVRAHFTIAKLRDDPKHAGQPAEEWKKAAGERPIMEQLFADAVEHHAREGFLHLKLAEPRSYDYNRVRDWDDRLRMPQFKFSRTHRRGEGANLENLTEYVKRRDRESKGELDAISQFEEARARERVMTFVLGLVAEPVPLKFVNSPKPDRLAEVKGLQILQKYNCAGCHEVRPGVYQFKVPDSKKLEFFGSLEGFFRTDAAGDHYFGDSTAWAGRPSPIAGIMMAHGVSINTDIKKTQPHSALTQTGSQSAYSIRLTEALRFVDARGEVKSYPAGLTLNLPPEFLTAPVAETFGGDLARLLGPYLNTSNADKYKAIPFIRASLPPPLFREGEKVQPSWLFQFLLDPTKVRPATVLRMPKFNLSEDEARGLVDYFAAVDKVINPNAGLNEAFAEVPQQKWSFWVERNQSYLKGRVGFAEYLANMAARKAAEDKAKANPKATPEELQKASDDAFKTAMKDALDRSKKNDAQFDEDLKGVWLRSLREQEAIRQLELDGAELAVTNATKEDKPAAEKARDDAKKLLDELRKDLTAKDTSKAFKDFEASVRREQVYAAHSHRLVTDTKAICVTCHSVGNQRVKDEQGPNLALAQERLRPRWSFQWIANPDRLISYPSHMPQNFKNNDPALLTAPIFLEAKPRETAEAARDVLMNFRAIDKLPVNRFRLTPKGGEYRESGYGDR